MDRVDWVDRWTGWTDRTDRTHNRCSRKRATGMTPETGHPLWSRSQTMAHANSR